MNKVKGLLYVIIIISSLADTMLLPFYPQFFSKVYQVESLLTSGVYIALSRLALMLSFQFWAWLSQKVPTMRILMFTQGMAAVACLACAFSPTFILFVVFSFIADIFKSSYLLVYPHLVKVSGREKQGQAIAYFGLIMNSTLVVASLTGGYLLDHIDPRYIIVAVAVVDFIQMLLSRYIIGLEKKTCVQASEEEQVSVPKGKLKLTPTLLMAGILTFIFYFGYVALRPYFTKFLEEDIHISSLAFAGVIFMVPNIMAAIIAPFGAKITTPQRAKIYFIIACWGLIMGTFFQGWINDVWVIVLSRMLYGGALFVIEIILDYLVFHHSKEEDMVKNYSYINFIQNLAYLTGPLIVAWIVDGKAMSGQFYLGVGTAVVLLVTTLIFSRRNLQWGHQEEKVLVNT